MSIEDNIVHIFPGEIEDERRVVSPSLLRIAARVEAEIPFPPSEQFDDDRAEAHRDRFAEALAAEEPRLFADLEAATCLWSHHLAALHRLHTCKDVTTGSVREMSPALEYAIATTPYIGEGHDRRLCPDTFELKRRWFAEHGGR